MEFETDSPSVTFTKQKKVEPVKPVEKQPVEKQTDADVQKRKKEVDEAAKSVTSTLFDRKAKTEKVADKPAEKKEVVDEKVEKPAEEEKIEEAAKIDKKPAPKPAVRPAVKKPSVEEIADKAAAAAAKKVVENLDSEEDEPVVELTPEDQDDRRIFEKMEQRNPAKYKGISEKFQKFAKARYDYETNWLKNNPGKDFNPEDEEHEDFFKKQPQFDERDYSRAEQVLVAEEALDNQMRPVREQEELNKEIQKARPVIAKQVNDRVHKLVGLVSQDIAKVLVDAKGNLNLSKENVAKVMELDPIAGQVLDDVLKDEFIPMMSELEKTTIPKLNYKLNPANPIHSKIIDQIRFYEESMTEAPDEVKVRNEGGVQKQFITISDKNALIGKIVSSKISDKAKQSKINAIESQYWSVGIDDIEDMILDDAAEKAKAQIERFNRIGSKKFGKPASEVREIARNAPQKSDSPSKKLFAKPTPPKEIGGSDVVQVSAPTNGGDGNMAKSVTKKLFDR